MSLKEDNNIKYQRSNKSRKHTQEKKNKDLEELPILFLLHNSLAEVEIEFNIDWETLPFHDKKILNLDIFELNDVMSVTKNDHVPYGQLMNVEHNTRYQ